MQVVHLSLIRVWLRQGSGAVGVVAFNHRAIESRSWERAAGFYRDILGLRDHQRPYAAVASS